MARADIERVLGAFNRWVEMWNRHEASRDLPLSPKSDEGTYCWVMTSKSVLYWRDFITGTDCVMRVKGWQNFTKQPSPFQKQTADPADVIWAAWLPSPENPS